MKKDLTQTARKLRNIPTEAEKYLWYVLRLENLGFKFRRQGVIGIYIVDFVCYERHLIVEVDGGQHAESQEDKIRDQWLNKEGYEVLRFWNTDVLMNRDGVLAKIVEYLKSPSRTLPTRGRENMRIN